MPTICVPGARHERRGRTVRHRIATRVVEPAIVRFQFGKRGVRVIRRRAARTRTDARLILAVDAGSRVVVHFEAHGAAGNIGEGGNAAAGDVLAHRSGVLELARDIHAIGDVGEIDAKLIEGIARAVHGGVPVEVELGVDAALGRHVPGVEEVERGVGVDELISALVLLSGNELPGEGP